MRQGSLSFSWKCVGAQLIKISVILLSIVLLIILIPVKFELVLVPELRVKVINDSGRPVNGVLVKQFWYHYDYEGIVTVWQGTEQELTDKKGEVTFPKRVLHFSALEWIQSKWNVVSKLPNFHASSGADALILTVDGDIRTESADLEKIIETGNAKDKMLVLKEL